MTRDQNGQRPLWKSFSDGLDGMRDASRGRIMKFIFACILFSVAAGLWRGIVAGPLSPLSWILLVGVSGIMCSFECLNTALELMLDRLIPEHDPVIRRIKHLLPAAGCFIGLACLAGGILVLYFNPGACDCACQCMKTP